MRLRLPVAGLFLSLFSAVRSDLAVHCEVPDLLGEWEFVFYQFALGSISTCGYSSPNTNAELVKQSGSLLGAGFPEKVLDAEAALTVLIGAGDLRQTSRINLNLEDKRPTDDGYSTNLSTTWSPVFDQGIMLKQVAAGGRTYFRAAAYSLFVCDASAGCSPEDQPSVNSNGTLPPGYSSRCDGTFIGWALHAQGMDCFIGRRVASLKGSVTAEHHDAAADHLPTRETFEIKSHPDEWTQFLQSRNTCPSSSSFFPRSFVHPSVLIATMEDPPKRQSCGDCFAIATAFALEAQAIRADSPGDVNSRSHALSLSLLDNAFTGQGCSGSHPLMLAMFLAAERLKTCPISGCSVASFDFIGGSYPSGCGIVEKMKQYISKKGPVVVGMDLEDHDALNQGLEKLVVEGKGLQCPTDAEDVTGGRMGELLMGAFSESPSPSPSSSPSSLTQICIPGIPHALPVLVSTPTHYFTEHWEFANHAMVVVGWGEGCEKTGGEATDCKPIPFWVVRNSWGRNWGINGLFLVKMGVDLAGIESQPMAMV